MAPPLASPKEIFGWYLYDVANSSYFFAVLIFFPLIILQTGTEIAHREVCTNRLADNVSVMDTTLTTEQCNATGEAVESEWCDCLLNTSLWKRIDASTGFEEDVPEHSQVVFLGLVQTSFTTLWSIGIATSVTLQLIVFICFASMGDFGGWRKFLFLLCNTMSGLARLLVGIVGGSVSQLSLDMVTVCGILSNVSMGFATVMYYAYLPLLVDSHPEVLEASVEDKHATKQVVESRLSNIGVRSGFVGQLSFLVFAGAMLATNLLSLHMLVLCGGVWVLILGTYSILSLEQRPGRSLPKGSNYCLVSLDKLRDTCGKRGKLPQLFIFLVAYLIYSDGTSSTASQAPTFSQNEMGASNAQVIGLAICLSLSGIAGTIVCLRLQTRYKIEPKILLMVTLMIQSLLPFAAVFVTDLWQLFIAACIFGFGSGPCSAYTRSVYSALLPKGHEAEFFGLFQITDRGTAWAGPLLVVWVSNASNYRWGYTCLLVFYWLGLPFLCWLQPAKAIAEKRDFEAEEKASMSLDARLTS